MFASTEQIVSLYENSGLSPEQIGFEQESDVMAVKATLMQSSSKYRADIKAGAPDLDFTDDEAQQAKKVILSLMNYSEDDNLRARMAMRVYDEKKGRLDLVKAMNGANINIAIFQQQLERTNQAIAKTESLRSAIDNSKRDIKSTAVQQRRQSVPVNVEELASV